MRNNVSLFDTLWGMLVCFMAGSVAVVGVKANLPLMGHFACGFTSATAFIAGLKMILGLWDWSWRR